MAKFLAIIYEIWNARNLLVFQEKDLPPQEISTTAFKRLHEGILKANVDAHLSSDGHWFSGMVLRRSDGGIVGAATRVHKGSIDVITGEALGLNDVALDWIEKLDEHHVILEMDSQIIVKAIKDKAEIWKNWGWMVRRCIKFLDNNPNADIRWVPRGANRVAHEMAKWAQFEPNNDWSNCVPMCIWLFIQKDKGFVIPD
ncbi:60S ribosomal protein l23 [Trifolium pratense]|uniref:60S ribosomal protein l23 n=1 Tax=Trifolium pratense TaxID=57577 RepID=A0A2K3NVH9_TRIPR|nr:60S ribosomal protein l23 [Trifolium pratense]